MLSSLDGILWLVLSLGPLLILQRALHKEVQAIFLLLTRRVDIAITLFSVVFFPGILLHEGSHFVMAHLLGVKTGRFSLIPRPTSNRKLQLGYVETARTDWLRDALIGMAPLLIGGAFVAYVGLVELDFLSLARVFDLQGLTGLSSSARALVSRTDFWVWFYLALVVSSTMLPSESDRRAWLPLGLILLLILAVSLSAGAGPWIAENIAEPFNRVIRSVSTVFGVSAFLHLTLLPVVALLRFFLSRLTRSEVML